MEAERDEALKELARRGSELATITAERDNALELVKQSKGFVESAKEAMSATFVEAASSVFDEKSAVLDRRIKETGEQSKVRLEETLKPFAENVAQFRQRMEDLNTTQTREPH